MPSLNKAFTRLINPHAHYCLAGDTPLLLFTRTAAPSKDTTPAYIGSAELVMPRDPASSPKNIKPDIPAIKTAKT